MDQFKKDFGKYGIIGMIIIMIIIGLFQERNASAEKTRKPNAQQVCAIITFEVFVEESPSLVFTTNGPDDILPDQTPCSTTISTHTQTACRYTRKKRMYEGDSLYVDVHRAFTAGSPNDRMMFHVKYPSIIKDMGTDPAKETFTDPNGHGHGRVHVAIGGPEHCVQTQHPPRRRY